jgi:hypothetical protein
MPNIEADYNLRLIFWGKVTLATLIIPIVVAIWKLL